VLCPAAALLCIAQPGRAELGPTLIAVTGAFSAAPTEAASEPAPKAAAVGRRSSAEEPASTDARVVARTIARRVRHFRAFRAEATHGLFRKDARAVWQVRSSARCLAALASQRVPATPLTRPLATPVPAAVVLSGPVRGVRFRAVQSDRAIEVSCELAARLPALAAILREHGVRAVHVNSSYREQPRVSFHTFGLALDISAFETSDGSLVVARDYELTPDQPTCSSMAQSQRGRALQNIACALAQSGLFSTVITPNYNEGHRDHFHLDIRPNDPNLFVR
jgi:hypothetical protein